MKENTINCLLFGLGVVGIISGGSLIMDALKQDKSIIPSECPNCGEEYNKED